MALAVELAFPHMYDCCSECCLDTLPFFQQIYSNRIGSTGKKNDNA